MFNLNKLREYSNLQGISTILLSIISLYTVVDILNIKKYSGLSGEIVLTIAILSYMKIFHEGKGRFVLARTGESWYFTGNKSKIVSLLLLMGLIFVYLMVATYNANIFYNITVTFVGILLFLPFIHYDEEPDIQDIHTLESSYLSRGEAIFYRFIFYLLSLIFGVYLVAISRNFLNLDQNSDKIFSLLFIIVWVAIISRPINKLTTAGK